MKDLGARMRMGSHLLKLLLFIALIFMAFPSLVRAFPEFEVLPQGGYPQLPKMEKIHFGRVQVRPGFAFQTKYTDNLFLTANKTFQNGISEGRNEDLIFSLKPSLLVQMVRRKGEPLGFNLYYEGEDQHYVDLAATQNTLIHHTGGSVNFGGAGGRTELSLGGSYHKTNSFIGLDFLSNLGNRVGVETYIADSQFLFMPSNQLKTFFKVNVMANRFDQTFQLQQDVDLYNLTTGFLKQANAIFAYGLKYNYRINIYKTATDLNDTSFSHQGFLTLRWEPNELIESELSLGFESKNFKRFSNEDLIRPIALLDVTYKPVSRTEITFQGMTEIQDSTFISDIQTFIHSKLALGLSQKLGYKFTFETNAQIEHNDYKRAAPDFIDNGGGLIIRVDNIVEGSAALVYDIKDWLKVRAKYRYRENISNFNEFDFIANSALFEISAKY